MISMFRRSAICADKPTSNAFSIRGHHFPHRPAVLAGRSITL
jgi:hypothetical protein